MAIAITSETQKALGDNARNCASRSLFKDRFANPQAKDDERKQWFSTLLQKSAEKIARSPWLPATSAQLHARLMSRLLVDLSGGVMENANVNLDRYGLPLIPGSAVKGCARRMALQALHDWIEAGTDRPATDDACAPCCDGLTKPAEMLAAIARIFGWTPKDWSDPSDRSDFAWATHGDQALLQSARALLPTHDTFAGTIAFLAASPNCDPGLELDVVTPHHTKYYQGDPAYSTAPDTEDPIPVFFPAVKPQSANDHFTFPLIPLRLAKDGDLAHAKRWLAHGLELFGLGAKTNAGYGWFDASDSLQRVVQVKQDAARKAEAERKQQEAEKARQTAEQEAARQKREQESAATAGMSEDEKADYQVAQLSDAQFEHKVKSFFKEPKKGGPSETEKKAIVRALRGSRLAFWHEFKAKAAKGGDLAKSEQAIRTLNKSLSGDKMP